MAAIKTRIKKGDNVVIIAGKDKGKAGEVIKVLPKEGRLVVSGVNLQKRHTKASHLGAGGINQVEGTVDISNVSIKDPKTGEATRVGYKTLDDGKKVRFAKKSGEVIDN